MTSGLWSEWSGPPTGARVAFVHGSPDTSRSFAPVVALLGDVRALLYDRRGWGRSLDVLPPVSSLDDHVDDLLGLLDGRPATVIAHSFGCCVAMLTSIRSPEAVAALGLWEPPFPWEEWWPELARAEVAKIVDDPDPEAVGERLVRRVLGHRAWDRLDDQAKQRRRAEGRTFVEEAREQLLQQFHLDEVTVPCVIGAGRDTWAHMVDATRRVSTSLGAELVEVDDAHHFAHVTHPEEFAAFTRRALHLGSR